MNLKKKYYYQNVITTTLYSKSLCKCICYTTLNILALSQFFFVYKRFQNGKISLTF